MATELWFSDSSDPFRDCSVLSLLPRTLGNAHQLGSVETLFESMARKGATQLLEQAHTISKIYSNLPNLGGRDGKTASSPNGKDHPQGRRPGLGRKRAQFSLKPVAIDVLPSIDHIEDPEEYFLAFEQRENAERELKKLRGEDTTALAQHHQSTTTRKRRPGLLGKTTSYKHLFPANADGAEAFSESQEPSDRRISSPSKTSNVMELYKALHSGASGKLVTSQAKKTDGEPLVAMDKEGSMADKEKNIQNILGKLMTEFNNLDGDEGMVLLKESLQLKQIDVGKIFLPELGSTLRIGGSVFNNKRTGGKSEGSQFPQDKPSLPKSPLAAISTLQRRISLRNPVKDFYSLPPNNDSPCSRDSPISKGQNGESISLTDTSHNDKTHQTPWDGAASMVMETGKRLSFEHEMHSPVPDADRTPGSKVTLEEELRECPSCLLEKNTNHHSSRDETSKEDASGAVDSRLQEEAPYSREPSVSKSQDRDSATLTHINDNEKSSLIRDTSAALVGIENKSCFELKMHSPVSEVGLTTDNLITSEGELTLTGQTSLWGNYTNQNSGEADNANDVFTGLNGSLQEVRIAQVESLITDPLGTAVEDLTAGSVNYSGTEGFSNSPHSKTGLQSTGLFGLDNNLQTEVNAMGQKPVDDAEPFVESSNIPEATTSMDGQLENTFVLPEEQGHKKASGTPLKKGMTKKVPPRRRSKRKDISGRQSLAGAGLEWKSGVRRSSRIRSRPLQYWLGERFLYGRIHDSLATVIGLKYASPTKEGKDPVLKVKSYVPEEYSDLVAQAGLH